jgi:two-component system chemotaxis sensor kinase CheA
VSSDFSPELKRELLDDFYAECDELLTNIRGALSQLEDAVGQREADPAVVESLFRHVHSLKGISAIVGLRPAEQLAHGMEDLMRGISRDRSVLTEAKVNLLSAATQRLEQIVVSHRLAKTVPEIGDVLEQLQRAVSKDAGRPLTASLPVKETRALASEEPAGASVDKSLPRFLVSFAPSAALSERGINVNAVRDRLKAIGEIETATPSVKGKGAIVFEFVVAVREVPGDFSPWENDGMNFNRLPESPSVQPTPAFETDSSEALSIAPSHIVRVDLTRLDDLMRITGEMVILRSRLEERLNKVAGEHAGLKEINLAFARSLREMRAAVSKVRTVPIAEIFSRIPFVVRDLSRGSTKKARVALEGRHTEVDKYIVERLKEPLLHLVRNAFAHGIETPEERVAAGKPPEATIQLGAKSSGQSVVIQIRDDGRGIDAATIVTRAKSLGLAVPDHVDSAAVLKILCAPGFSTREEADLAAGRGVGMAVVANTVRELGGALSLDSTPGTGTEFTLKLPVTLSIADAIIVTVGGETCAVPQSAVDEIIQISASEVRTIKQTEVIPYRGGLLPLVRLRKIFRLPSVPAEILTLLVVRGERGATGLTVDRVLAQREIVLRPLLDPLLQVPGISGATELGDGRPILILDPIAITDGVVRPNSGDSSGINLSEPRAS